MLPIVVSPLFTPLASLAGGSMIGASSSIMLGATGRVMGISGIINGVVTGAKDRTWRLSFLGGMLAGGAALTAVSPAAIGAIPVNAAALLAAGTVVGFGTQMGSGCTSGHGVCGLPRFSMRSLVAVSSFMTTGILTRTAITHSELLSGLITAGGSVTELTSGLAITNPSLVFGGLAAGTLLHVMRQALTQNAAPDNFKSIASSYASGALFSVGLGVSGMSDPTKVLGFLDVLGVWDPSLAFVMGGAVGLNLITFRAIFKRANPLFTTHFNLPTRKDLTNRLTMGSALFGVGWGLAGICPGPAFLGLASGDISYGLFCGAMVGGMHLYRALNSNGTLPAEKIIFGQKPHQGG
eukprot:comp39091_c0_seq1/m.47371 comp39091_c0_seq1/g.47371  ORF comp39091_c0_seq1/g.47371 comp39091_c0_seq1/m.47371 type:complete len:351 (-) comp39091_c0_seq1:7-1059(-)